MDSTQANSKQMEALTLTVLVVSQELSALTRYTGFLALPKFKV